MSTDTLGFETPIIYEDEARNPSTGNPLVAAHTSMTHCSPGYEISKRLFDLVVALSAVLLLSPVFAVIAVAIKLTSPGPILFRQKRLGRNGELFWCFKFRTMVCGAEQRLQQSPELRKQFEQNYKLKNDPRLTRIGSFLRTTSLDELPQFLNVVRSDMSIIGPRPIVPPEISKYGPYGDKLLTVKPGLGGMWQAMGRSDTSYTQRIELDMAYIDSCSLGLDIRLFISTILAVIKIRGAY
ncbi:MAG: sugar transferase [Armatimonadota bacterium]|nr:sugar transferase [Armatimonadota bacterium]